MRTYRKVSRRSFMATVAGTAVATSLVVGSRRAEAHQGCSDTDSGTGADPGGRGRRCAGRPYTGCSDRDPTDPGGRGVNCGGQPRGCTDVDPTDRAGQGRSCGGVRTQTACSQCSCIEYIPSPNDRYARCARPGCGHYPNYHYGD